MHRRRALLIGIAVAALCVSLGAVAATKALSPQRAGIGPPRFVEETGSAGVAHVYDGPFEYAAGGGVAVFDCNGDGKPDLYLAGGANPATLYRNDSTIAGALHFSAVADPTIDLTGVTGAYPIDLDGDGVTDLVVLRNGESVLLRGLGACRFERANERWAFHLDAASTMAFSATWESGETLPTLAFGNYVDPASNDSHRLCFDNALLRPDASGKTYASPIALRPGWCALSMLFSDWNRSGHQDLRVSNDQHYYLPEDGEEQLWRVAPGLPPTLYTGDDGWVKTQVEGMGIASYDVTGDGYPEVFLTSRGDNRLQTLAAGPSRPMYRDIGLKRGVNAAQPFTGGDVRPSTAWHDEFEDVDNDGLVDLFVAKGNVTDQPEYAAKDPSNLLLGQTDGTFREAADVAGILNFDRGRGAALADFNLDGMLDLIEVRVGDRIQRRELTIGGGHAGGQLGWIHFGLGAARAADVRVLWPGGEAGAWMHLAANEFAVLRRGATEATRWNLGL